MAAALGYNSIFTLVFFFLTSEVLASKWDAPTWPAQYEVSFTLTIPYVKQLQTDGLEYTYTFWRDTHNGRQKMVRDGKETQFVFLQEGMKYDIVPAKDHLKCFKNKIGGGSGPTTSVTGGVAQAPSVYNHDTQRRKLQDAAQHKFTPEQLGKLGFLLPDLSEKRWQRNGTVMRDNTHLHRFTYLLHKDMGYGTVAGQYDFLVDASGTPKELLMWGINLYTGGHFDDYRVQYTSFHAGPIDEEEFDFDPSNCTQLEGMGEDLAHPSHMPGSGAAAAARVLPNVHHGDHEYDLFVHRSGRRHGSVEEYHARKQVYYHNKRVVEECNAANRTYTCAINQFGDWTAEERRTLLRRNTLTGRTTGATHNKEYKYMKPHTPVVPLHFLPTTVDWRGNPADSPVKDQAACGSCWAFSTIQALESAYFRATGKPLLLSEQHFLNCAWNVPQNHGCFGGDQDMALEWVFEQGVIATEEALPYLGVFDYCPSNLTGYVRFEGHWSLVEPGEQTTMEALLTKGPLTVSVDASQEDMTFYKSGIYSNPKCATKETELDHAVMLSGYGEENGHTYWIVKNTWSTYWGEGGYFRISRAPDDCGIAAQVMYAEMHVIETVNSD